MNRTLATIVLAAGLVALGSPALAHHDTGNGVTTSRGYTYDAHTGVLSWGADVTVKAPYDTAVLYDASTKPQTVLAGPVQMSLGPGPRSVVLGSPRGCGAFQWDVRTPRSKAFVAGHKFELPCETTPPTTPPTTEPPVTTPPTTPPATTPPVVTTPPTSLIPPTSTTAPAPVRSVPELAQTGPLRTGLAIGLALLLIAVGVGLTVWRKWL